MSDLFHDLVQDTLKFLKDPLLPKETLFATAEELVLFQRKAEKREPPQVGPMFQNMAPLAGISTPGLSRGPSGKDFLERPLAPVFQSKPYAPPPLPVPRTKAPPAPREEVVQVQVEAPPPPKAEAKSDPIKALLQKVAPSMKLVEEVPDDAEAKKIATGWKEKIADAEVILLACETDPETLDLLKNLAKAIDTHLGKTKILPAERLEKEKRWDLFLQKNTFRLVLASDGVKKLPELMQFYRALPAQGLHFLDKTPLFVLAPAATYKAIEQKAALWKTLCQILTK